jgi:O-antigen/teichoic acid export membrane protein
VSIAAVSGSAAVAGVILSRKFGHGVKTDGFFAAYGVYLAIVLVANALRVVVLPRFAAARAEGRLAGEVGTWMAALAVPLVPAVVVSLVWPGGIAHALAGNAASRHAAAELLPWLIPAAAAQVYAGVLASALAAVDDYVTAALGFGLGAVTGLAVIGAVIGHGVVAFGWGLAANGALAVAVPLRSVLSHRLVARPDASPFARLHELVDGVALPFALQGLYVIGLRFALGLGTGEATTFSYAYLIAASLVAVTATSIALVATVPFAREGSSPERVSRHVVSISWLSLAVVAAAAGVFALAGATVVQRVLGSSYGGGTGAELGRLVVYLAPWMVASVAVTVAYPLLFVRGRARWLPLVAAAVLGVHTLVEWGARAAFGLAGVAAGLAVTTALVLVVLLGALGALRRSLEGLALAGLACAGVAVAAFVLPRTVLGPVAAAAAGLVLYAGALVLWRPPGLRHAWAYVRALQ